MIGDMDVVFEVIQSCISDVGSIKERAEKEQGKHRKDSVGRKKPIDQLSVV